MYVCSYLTCTLWIVLYGITMVSPIFKRYTELHGHVRFRLFMSAHLHTVSSSYLDHGQLNRRIIDWLSEKKSIPCSNHRVGTQPIVRHNNGPIFTRRCNSCTYCFMFYRICSKEGSLDHRVGFFFRGKEIVNPTPKLHTPRPKVRQIRMKCFLLCS